MRYVPVNRACTPDESYQMCVITDEERDAHHSGIEEGRKDH